MSSNVRMILIALFSLTLVSMQSQTTPSSLLEIQAQHQLQFKQEFDGVYNIALNYFSKRQVPVAQFSRKHSNAVLSAALDYFKTTGGLKQKLALSLESESFSFSLNRPEGDDQARQGSFHRSRKSVFLSIDDIERNMWLMTLVHELAHAKDDVMFNSLVDYDNPFLEGNIVRWSNAGLKFSDLSKQDQNEIRTWLLAGLQRGFLAEYRAWLLTYLIYEEGRIDGTFEPIAWLEDIKSTKPANRSIALHILSYLNPGWKDPTTEIFGHLLVQEALAEVRLEIMRNPCKIQLGEIGVLLGKKKVCR